MVEAVVTWLLTPLSGAATHDIAMATAWHARLMVLSWGMLSPLGALAARYYKILPRQAWPRTLDNQAWWRAHLWLQGSAVACMTAGLALALMTVSADGAATSLHALFGWLLCLTGWLQAASGLLRGSKGGPSDRRMRGDHYDMTRRRLCFERFHKAAGWLGIVAAVPTIAIGLVAADAPRWMGVALALWWAGLAACFVYLQRRGRCVDTYQAIWGPDPRHPGNRIAPVGWGVRRYTAESWRQRPGLDNKNT